MGADPRPTPMEPISSAGRMIAMDPSSIDPTGLEFDVVGRGEPVIFIHGVLIADIFRPLLAEPSLVDRYRVCLYHRHGCAGSAHTSSRSSIAGEATACRVLMQALGMQRAHIVGHSLGGAIALQLALDAPGAVHSLTLLEPAVAVGESLALYRAALQGMIDRSHTEDTTALIDAFLEARGPGYRTTLDRVLPGAFDQALRDAATTFDHDLPALLNWQFGDAEAGRIDRPVLSILGGDSEALWPRFGETHRQLLAWWPHAEEALIPQATHLMMIQNPAGTAQAIADFLERHPISGSRVS